ncbi:hypothetical protein A8144_12620 [Mycobacterium leprae 3125609]|nr:hypothetical protein A8144_12620 [Mycobacterium leprae 3125609]OAX70386.1 hypothetical protein A3216_12265 [Mycobacterium leprae 7935681]
MFGKVYAIERRAARTHCGDRQRAHRLRGPIGSSGHSVPVLLGKVTTVGDAVPLLPSDLSPGTSTSANVRALASEVSIS